MSFKALMFICRSLSLTQISSAADVALNVICKFMHLKMLICLLFDAHDLVIFSSDGLQCFFDTGVFLSSPFTNLIWLTLHFIVWLKGFWKETYEITYMGMPSP